MQKTERERAWPQERGEKDSFGAKLRIRHSVDCRMAACDAELSQADRLWKRRYEDVGLLDTTAADDQPATVGLPRTPAWRPLVLLAFRVTEITSDIVSTHRIDRAGLSLGRRVDESICGTVTLLVPGDR